ncbi:MAG: hypothetical protein LUD81_10560 [Clostridiales bacterium]|nr:hypothetical protein [Clostridiales bacterium]
MTTDQVKLLKLGIEPVDDKLCLAVESGLEWVLKNTSLSFDITSDDDLAALPANVRLFAAKYAEIMRLRFGISSESISNLSQSFNTSDFLDLISDLAEELLGDEITSGVKFVSAVRRWK